MRDACRPGQRYSCAEAPEFLVATLELVTALTAARHGVVQPPARPDTNRQSSTADLAGRGAPVSERPGDKVPAAVGNRKQ